MYTTNFRTMDYEFYQLHYHELANTCRDIEKFPTPTRVERTYSPADGCLIFVAYWTGNDCQKPVHCYKSDSTKFVIVHKVGKLVRYVVASQALEKRHFSCTNEEDYSIEFKCDKSPRRYLYTIMDYIKDYKNLLKYSTEHQERDDMNSEHDTQPRSPHIHYYKPEIVIKQKSDPNSEYCKQLFIRHTYYNEPNTTIEWSDGSKTVVGCSDKDSFDKEIGLAVAIAEKYFQTLGSQHPRATLKKFAESGIDQTEKTKARKAFKAAKKKLHEEESSNESAV